MRHLLGSIPLVAIFGLASLDSPTPGQPAPAGTLSSAEQAKFADRFERDVWPLLIEPADARKACGACHHDDGSNTSTLVLAEDPKEAFDTLLDEGFFDRENPDALLARIARKATSPKRMPPEPAPSWSEQEIEQLRRFVSALEEAQASR
ncbi:hypothetical protein EP7_003503 [Isosphaeraceae bacterium EP7]